MKTVVVQQQPVKPQIMRRVQVNNARRHAAEIQARVLRQEILILDLLEHGSPRFLPSAEAVLDRLRDLQHIADNALDELEVRDASPPRRLRL